MNTAGKSSCGVVAATSGDYEPGAGFEKAVCRERYDTADRIANFNKHSALRSLVLCSLLDIFGATEKANPLKGGDAKLPV